MARYTTTPWRHPSDLLTIRSQLYPLNNNNTNNTNNTSSPQPHHHAISRILAWKLRSPNLPHAIESTALLLDSIQHHANAPKNSPYSIRAVYAAAFTRFVTGFADIGRARSGKLAGPENQSSMLEVARQIGMPAEFVALRHEATHEELPSVGRLRKAVERGLEWLWEVYWSRLPDEDGEVREDGVVQEDVREEMRRVLRGYRGARREAFKGGKKGRQEHEDVLNGLYEQMDSLLASGSARVELLATLLVDEKLLFPSSRSLGASMEGAFKIWDDLLIYINRITTPSQSLTPILVNHLLEALPAQATERDIDAENVYLWLLHLIDSHALPGLKTEVIKYCCLHASYWTQKLGTTLLEHGKESFRDDWEDLFEASRVLDGDPDDNVEAGAADEKEDDEMGDADAAVDVAGDRRNPMLSSGTSNDVGGGWRLAAIPPSVPIGVVS